MISARTKAAMAAAKARGVQFGSPTIAAANRQKADAHAESLRDIVEPIKRLSTRRIAAVLNERGVETSRGGKWQSTTITPASSSGVIVASGRASPQRPNSRSARRISSRPTPQPLYWLGRCLALSVNSKRHRGSPSDKIAGEAIGAFDKDGAHDRP